MDKKTASVENIYQLDGKVPVARAVPFGLQHILAMFVANIAPIFIVAGACGLSSKQSAMLIQSAMIIAGIGTLIQLFPIWRIGSGLPIVMGISFTFVSVFCYLGPEWLQFNCRRCSGRRSCRRGAWAFCKALVENHYSNCGGECGDSNWFLAVVRGSGFLWWRKRE